DCGAWVGRCNSGDMLVALGDIQKTFFRPAPGQQLILREISRSLGNSPGVPAKELTGLLKARPAGGSNAPLQIDRLECFGNCRLAAIWIMHDASELNPLRIRQCHARYDRPR